MKVAASWLAVIVLVALPAVAEAWWNDDWSYRKRIDLVREADGFTSAGLADTPVLVRLTNGNFAYFLDAAPDGADVRFVAADDTTPLEFDIERYDGVAGVAAIWVKLPRIDPSEDQFFWMYYGNDSVATAADSAATYDVNQTAVFHFNEASGLPVDATAFGHSVERSSALPGRSGLIDAAIQFDGTQSAALAVTPALTLDAERGSTVSFWLRPEGRGEARALIYSQGTPQRQLSIGLTDLDLDLEFFESIPDAEANTPLRLEVPTALTLNRWHHVAVTIGPRVRLWLDGDVVAELDQALPRIGGAIVLGATNETNGFRGGLDELRMASTVRADALLRFEAFMHGADSQIVAAGEDESRSSAGGLGEYFALLWALLGAIRPEGWVILGLIVIMGLLSADVMINKSALLRRIERADATFLGRFETAPGRGDALPPEPDKDTQDSPLANVYRVAMNEWAELKALAGGKSATSESLEVVRSAIDAETVEQVNRLTSRLVLITIAVSGGPFLGLLGTVVGVMITFAAIAAAGDVNVNTIAPGVSAALTTTVFGLLVAIPSLFGYNYLTTRISKRTTAMEVFGDRVVARFALESLQGDRRQEVSDAA